MYTMEKGETGEINRERMKKDFDMMDKGGRKNVLVDSFESYMTM